jgi:hypothetical protein
MLQGTQSVNAALVVGVSDLPCSLLALNHRNEQLWGCIPMAGGETWAVAVEVVVAVEVLATTHQQQHLRAHIKGCVRNLKGMYLILDSNCPPIYFGQPSRKPSSSMFEQNMEKILLLRLILELQLLLLLLPYIADVLQKHVAKIILKRNQQNALLTTELQAQIAAAPNPALSLQLLVLQNNNMVAQLQVELTKDIPIKLEEEETVEYDARVKSHQKKVEDLKINWGKVYMLIMGQCT